MSLLKNVVGVLRGWLLPLAALAGGTFQTLTYELQRKQAFNQSSTARGIHALSNSATAVSLGGTRLTGRGLIWADLAGEALASAYVLKKIIAADASSEIWGRRPHAIRHLLRKYRQYPMFSLPGSLIDGIAIAVTPTFDPVTSGQYAVVQRSVALPIGVITPKVAQVFMASFASALRISTTDAVGLFRRVLVAHLKLALVPGIVVFGWGPDLFAMILGAKWREAGEFSRIMAPLSLMSFLVRPVNLALLLLGKQRINLVWNLLRAVALISAWALILEFHLLPKEALEIDVTINVAAYLALLALMFRSIERHVVSPPAQLHI